MTFLQEFEAAYRHGGLWMPVLHPFATGRLSRWTVVTEFLEQVLSYGDVWFASMENIAAHVERVAAGGEFTPRSVAIPQYSEPVEV